jgi:hypothetical protein
MCLLSPTAREKSSTRYPPLFVGVPNVIESPIGRILQSPLAGQGSKAPAPPSPTAASPALASPASACVVAASRDPPSAPPPVLLLAALPLMTDEPMDPELPDVEPELRPEAPIRDVEPRDPALVELARELESEPVAPLAGEPGEAEHAAKSTVAATRNRCDPTRSRHKARHCRVGRVREIIPGSAALGSPTAHFSAPPSVMATMPSGTPLR